MTRTPVRKISGADPYTLAVALAFLMAVTFPHMGMAQSPQTSQVYPRRWEYKVVMLGAIDGTIQQYGSIQNGAAFTKPFEDGLGKFGSEGWELVCIDILQGNKVAIFKRPNTAFSR